MSTTNYTEFGFGEGDESLNSTKFERFKAKEGQTYRMSFVWFPEEGGRPDLTKSPRFVGAKRFYIKGAGYVLDKGPEMATLADGPSKTTVATIIALWPVNRKDNKVDMIAVNNGDYQIVPWVFGQPTYEQLKRRNGEFPFGQFDISVNCVDTQFQKIDIASCRDGVYNALNTKTEALYQSHVLPMLDTIHAIEANIQGLIGRDMTLAQVREKLGVAGTPGAGGSGSGGTRIATSHAEVENLLDGLMDT